MSERRPTVEDVAARAGVSRQTVSNVLNTPEIVRPATTARVRAAIAELGYAPSIAARSLRTRRSHTIGIHLDPYAGGISGVLLDRFVHALTDRATPRGLRIMVYAAADADEEMARVRALRDGGEIDRVVLTGTFAGDPRAEWLVREQVPFVAFGRPWGSDGEAFADPGWPWVDVDGAAGVRAATEHLRARGPRVAFLGWPPGSGTGDDRERGWREAMGADADPALRWACLDDVQSAREVVTREVLARATDGAVDGVVCASDTLAVGAHLALGSGETSVPVIGFDNTPVAQALGISSVEQRPEVVAEAVLDLLARPSAAEVVRLIEPELVLRGTAG